ncbi:MAG TPA: bifunctional lytic transglycosylase/C40 family peptidase [Actinospica sp.]|nr:bifunctional lytic transglycosylase/C40 family peptidase [Actinospica sp.]
MAKIGAAAGAALLLVVILIGGAAAGVASILGLGSGSGSAPSAAATADIPAAYLALDMRAAATCPGLSWAVLAGIGKVESDFGRAADQVSSAGAVGPMQFLPATFAEYSQPIPPGGADPPTPWDPVDAVYAAARMLCANGAKNGADIPAAIFAYNHSDDYVSEVLSYAAQYSSAAAEAGNPASGSDSATVQTAIAYAKAQIGVPYEWAGDGPAHGQGFDCSGLVQAAFEAAGVTLPRVAQDQYTATKNNPTGGHIEPGDLVFYGTSVNDITHVGIYLGNNVMVDAPHTGAFVRTEDYRWSDFVGFTDPV